MHLLNLKKITFACIPLQKINNDSLSIIYYQEKHEETTRNKKANETMKEEIEEDYPQFDPAPSTKPAVKSGPIVHDTSVMPYVPRSAPPDHPMKGHP